MFDLNSQSGVMVILASVRASALSPTEKNEIRDLVFLYTNGGRDESVRIALEQKLNAHNIKPVAAKKVAAAVSKPILPFGSSRPTPTFKAPPIPPPVTAPVSVVPVQPLVSSVSPVSAPPAQPSVSPVPPITTAPVVSPAFSPPTQTVTPPVQSVTKQPVSVVSSPPAATVQSPVPTTVSPSPVAPPAPPVIPAIPTPAVPSTSSEAYLERIRQIKLAVNGKVGNPVNLVDINNEVGREYMNALLQAMKKLSAGAESEMPRSMMRLEAAYLAVEETLKNYSAPATKKPQTDPRLDTTAPPPPSPSPVVPSASIPAPNNSRADANQFEDSFVKKSAVRSDYSAVNQNDSSVVTPNTFTSEYNFKNEQDLNNINDELSLGTGGRAQTPLTSRSNPGIAPGPNVILDARADQTPVLVTPPTPLRQQVARDTSPGLSPAPMPVPTPTPPKPTWTAPLPTAVVSTPRAPEPVAISRPPSLADQANIRTPADLPDSASLETGASGDVLFNKEVDDGLEQLLSDWILFKKSGFLGRGPKGREHPLFKKIADLPVPLLLAGRFDGATQEVRQSITDYMNGWRYEQGIIYEQGETFERYLRRVIRHILGLQKKRKGR